MTPEQEEQVRRALAAAARAEDHPDGAAGRLGDGHPADAGERRRPPLPADVADRLDTVLDELLAPRITAAAPSGDDELARRRRRRWPNGLVAAAALCAIALAGGAAATGGFGLTNGSGSDSRTAAGSASADSAAPESASKSASGSASGSGAGSDSRAASSPPAPAPTSPGGSTAPSDGPRELAATGSSPTFRTETLAADLQRLVDGPGPLPTGEQPSWRCVAPPVGAGEQLLGVRVDGRRSSLVLGAPSGGERSARIYSCADPSVLVATTTVHTARP